jgi:hypothetical protein
MPRIVTADRGGAVIAEATRRNVVAARNTE